MNLAGTDLSRIAPHSPSSTARPACLIAKHVEVLHGADDDGNEPPRLRLIFANPDYAPYSCLVQDAHILGKVVWAVRRV